MCTQDIIQVKDSIKCSECPVVFHPECAGISGDKKISTRKAWKCDMCAIESASISSRKSEVDQNAVLDAISSLRKDINYRLDKTNDNIEGLRSDITSAVKDIGILKTQYEDLKTSTDLTATKVNDLEDKNIQLTRKVTLLEQEVMDLQQQSRKNNLIITGVPVSQRENIFAILDTMARILDVPFGRDIVSAAHRLPSTGDDKRPPLIVVCFVSRATKQDWMTARRTKRTLSAKELHSSFPDTPVFLNDHLTPHTRETFNAARKLVKEKKLEAVWTSDGRVLAKKSAAGTPFRIREPRQLQHLAGKGASSTE